MTATSCYAAENYSLYSDSLSLRNESSVPSPNPTTAPACCKIFLASADPCFSDICVTPYDQTSFSSLTSSPSSLQPCEVEDKYCEDKEKEVQDKYCEDKEKEKVKEKNYVRMTASGVTVLPSSVNSAIDTDADEDEQRNSVPSTNTLDNNIPMSEEAPLTLFLRRPEDGARKSACSTDTDGNYLPIFFKQSEEPSAEGLSFTPQTPSCSPPPLPFSSMQTEWLHVKFQSKTTTTHSLPGDTRKYSSDWCRV